MSYTWCDYVFKWIAVVIWDLVLLFSHVLKKKQNQLMKKEKFGLVFE